MDLSEKLGLKLWHNTSGAVMLDVECNNLTELANLVVDEMVKTGQIKPDDQGHVLRTLLAKHK